MPSFEDDSAAQPEEDASTAEHTGEGQNAGLRDQSAGLRDKDEAAAPAGAPVEELSLDELCRRVEAVLFSNREPLTAREIGRMVGASSARVRKAVEKLRPFYEETGRAFELMDEAGGYILLTRQRLAPYVIPPEKTAAAGKLTSAALEVLSVVAYEQPVSRMDVESVRGVASGPVLRTLLEKNLVRVAGRGEGLGSPLLYGTTERFLEVLGVGSLKNLPDPDTIEE